MRKVTGISAVALVVAGAAIGGVSVAAAAAAHHGDPAASPYLAQIAKVSWPAPYVTPAGFDISYVDPGTQTYYLSDQSNAGVAAINAQTDAWGGEIGAGDFTGLNTGRHAVSPSQVKACGGPDAHGTGGPNGVVTFTVGGVRQLAAGNGISQAHPHGNVKIFDLAFPDSGTLAATVVTGGVCRADSVAYDPADHLLAATNGNDTPPFLSLISVHANPAQDKVVRRISFPAATGGIDAPVYDQGTHLFYVGLTGEGVGVIDPVTGSLSTTFPAAACAQSGIALDPATQEILLACGPGPGGSAVMSARTGKILARIPQVSGADEAWFDPGSNDFYLGAVGMTSTGTAAPFGYPSPVIGVISAGSPQQLPRWVANIPTSTTGNPHSVAADPANRQVFVPIGGYGLAVFDWHG
ncbi:MAG TPA: hypothetical protein VMV92_13790 [Streptosporangiaceae bacterium]|nr:hypothetical protein [Streptosporangiaceae bacterium]